MVGNSGLRVCVRSTTDRHDPFAVAIWSFEDNSSARRVTKDLTLREREVAQFLVAGKSSKQIARDLNICFRTVEAHRARLMRKYGVGTASELIAHLIGRVSGERPAGALNQG